MAYEIRTTSNFFVCGITYAFFWWGLFAIYCIGYQLNRIRVYRIRKSRIAGKEDNVVTDLPGAKLYHRLDTVIRIPYCTEMIPVKHVIGIFIFTIVNLLFMFFAPFEMTPGSGYVLVPIGSFDRRAAFVGMVNWGFVFFLAQRNSLLPAMSGLTFEELIPFHRIIARIGLAEFMPHFVWRIWKGYEKHFIVKDALFRNEEQTTGTISMLGFLLVFVTSLEYIRRNHFEVFYYSHIVGMLVGIIFACWHEKTCFAFFIPAIILWFADRVVRSYKSWFVKSSSIRVDQVAPPSATQEGIVRILFENPLLRKFQPGQYVFASIATEGRKLWGYSNWHPFTISEVFRINTCVDSGIEERVVEKTEVGEGEKEDHKSKTGSVSDIESMSDASSLRRRANVLPLSQESKTVASFHIKALGNKTHQLLKSAAANEKLDIHIDGPYGPHLHYQDYQAVALFGAGIGATPAMAMIKDIVEKRSNGVRTVAVDHIYFAWAVRSVEEIHPFMDMFIYWNEKSKSAVQTIRLSLTVFVTRATEGPNVFEGLEGCKLVYGERPNIKVEMDKIKTVNANRRVWAHACGGDLFTRTVINEAARHRFACHNETFEF